MWDLLAQLVERMCIIVTIAFIITRLKVFRQLIHQSSVNWRGRVVLIGVFGLFGMIGNYTGIVVTPGHTIISQHLNQLIGSYYAIVETRNIGIIIGGLLGGPAVGLGAGVIAGGHRYVLGGFINTAALAASIAGGLMAGWIGKQFGFQKMMRPARVLVIGIFILSVQIAIIPIVAQDHETAFRLIQFTGLPIIIVNGIGIWICSTILYSVLREEEKTRAIQTQKALFIADETLPFFREGLNEYSCTNAAVIIRRLMNADAVAFTDRVKVLAHVGEWENHHASLQQLEIETTKRVLETGEIVVARSEREVSGMYANCPFHAAIILPLSIKGKIVGTLKLLFISGDQLSTVEQELAEGLAKLFSTQLELGETERHNKLLQDAEIKALQAQIHPHFLFNSINTIVALCRTDAMLARSLLIQLATFFRNNLQGARQTFVSISKEMENVQAYLSIEQARFPHRYVLHTNIDFGLESALLPPFTLQPLVENAVRHGFSNRKLGTIEITAEREAQHVKLTVSDDGRGIPEDKLKILGKQICWSEEGTGTAIQNISERLSALFGSDAMFRMESQINGGTRIIIRIPLLYEGGRTAIDQSVFGGGRGNCQG